MIKCDECPYIDILDWDRNEDGTAKAILWCEKHKDICNDAISICKEEENGRTKK